MGNLSTIEPSKTMTHHDPVADLVLHLMIDMIHTHTQSVIILPTKSHFLISTKTIPGTDTPQLAISQNNLQA